MIARLLRHAAAALAASVFFASPSAAQDASPDALVRQSIDEQVDDGRGRPRPIFIDRSQRHDHVTNREWRQQSAGTNGGSLSDEFECLSELLRSIVRWWNPPIAKRDFAVVRHRVRKPI